MPSHPPCVVTAAASCPCTNEGVCIPTEHSVMEPSWNRHIEDLYLPFPDKKTCFMLQSYAFRSQNTAWNYPSRASARCQDFCCLSHTIPRTCHPSARRRLRWCLQRTTQALSPLESPSVGALHHDFEPWIKVQIAFHCVVAMHIRWSIQESIPSSASKWIVARMQDRSRVSPTISSMTGTNSNKRPHVAPQYHVVWLVTDPPHTRHRRKLHAVHA
jgi:hypothetical protein